MLNLRLKRIILMTSLIVISAFLAIVQLQANQEEAKLQRLIINRNQKQDYQTLFNRAVYKSFTIRFSEDSFDRLLTQMQDYYDLFGNYRDNQMVPVDVIYQDGSGNEFAIYEAGFRTKSNTSRNLPLTYDWRGRKVYHQTSFQLQFNATHDYLEDSNEFVYLNQREVFDLRQINFEYALPFEGRMDEALITEAFAHQLLEQSGIISQKASYGIVYFEIGEERVGMGLYTLIEPVDSTFIKRHFPSNNANQYGDLFKATDINEIKAYLTLDAQTQRGINQNHLNIRYQYALANNTFLGTRTDFSKFDQWIQAVNEEQVFGSRPFQYIEVDKLLRFLAMSYLIGNTDDFRNNGNNYFLYFQAITNQAIVIPFDYDNALGFGRNQDPSDQYTTNYDLFLPQDALNPILSYLLNQPSYQEIYVNYIEQFIDQFFRVEPFLVELEVARSLYQEELIAYNHLGVQVFGNRNVEWYFSAKRTNALAKIEAFRTQIDS